MGTLIGTAKGTQKRTYMGTDIGYTKRNQMRIGHQLYSYLQDWTDAGHYDVQQVFFFMDSSQRKLCIKSLFINEEENQVYLVRRCSFSMASFFSLSHFPSAQSWSISSSILRA